LCEFKVFVNSIGEKKRVAEDVIKVLCEEGRYTLVDILGLSVELEDVLVERVDVAEEKIELIKHPLIGDFLKLIHADLERAKGLKSREEVAKIWEELKTKGDKILLG